MFQLFQFVLNQSQRFERAFRPGGGNIGRDILFRVRDDVPEKPDVFVRTLDAVKRSFGLIAHVGTYLARGSMRKYRRMAERVGFESANKRIFNKMQSNGRQF